VTPGGRTRPTTDRTREALFSSLESMLGGLEGAVVVDGFAGTGALGLEAWSRGASTVLLVERDPTALAVLRRNVAALGAAPAVRVLPGSVRAVLQAGPDAAGIPAPVDAVLLDPPYAMPGDELAGLLALLPGSGWLAGDAVVVVERGRRGTPVTWPDGVVRLRERRYGETTLWYGRAAARL
jgi:16S rRNA (guanine(966)-N(2))-methyltransferase RsmD